MVQMSRIKTFKQTFRQWIETLHGYIINRSFCFISLHNTKCNDNIMDFSSYQMVLILFCLFLVDTFFFCFLVKMVCSNVMLLGQRRVVWVLIIFRETKFITIYSIIADIDWSLWYSSLILSQHERSTWKWFIILYQFQLGGEVTQRNG